MISGLTDIGVIENVIKNGIKMVLLSKFWMNNGLGYVILFLFRNSYLYRMI